MKVFSWDDVINNNIEDSILAKGTALTVGVFDGIHIGHRKLFDTVLKGAERGLSCGVVTFTDKIFSLSKTSVTPIESLDVRLGHIEKMGFDFVILINFTPEVAAMEGRDFLEILYTNCGLKYLVEGDDFRFGKGGKTGKAEIEAFAQEKGISCAIIPPVLYGGERVSSTMIRNLLAKGKNEDAQKLM